MTNFFLIISMMEFFKSQLEQWSFQRAEPSAYFRDQKALRWWITQTQLSRSEAKFRFNAGISIRDPFAEDEGLSMICLNGDIEPDGVSTHFDETPYWWSRNEFGNARTVAETCLLFWFEYWSVSRLIAYFQKPVANVTFQYPDASGEGSPKSDKTPVSRKPPIHQLWLSLLHYHEQDYQQSLFCAERWHEVIKHLKDGKREPERTLWQIRSLRKMLNGGS